MLVIILTAFIAVLIWYYLVRPTNHFTRIGVKQAKPWPILGDLWRFAFRKKSLSELLVSLYDKFPTSRYMGFYLFTNPSLLVRDPDLIKQLTVKDFDHFTDRQFFIDGEDPFWGRNLAALRRLKWREMRATLTSSFTSSKMKYLFGIMNEVSETFVQYFIDKNEDSMEIEMKDFFSRFANDIIASSAFGIKTDSVRETENTFYSLGSQMFVFNGFWALVKYAGFYVAAKFLRLVKLTYFDEKFTNYFCSIIYDTIRLREEKGIVRKDMLNLLLETRKNSEEKNGTVRESNGKSISKKARQLEDVDIAAQAMIFFFAGFHTVSTALSFGAYELASNKEVQDKLRKEILETHRANKGELTYDALMNMKYLDQVFSETLRLWPPVDMIDRICTKPYTIEAKYPDEVPVNLKVDDTVTVAIFPMHRDPKYYENPNKFDPGRFSDERKHELIPYTYLPFGTGPRICIGSRFAILECKAVLYRLLMNFEFVPVKRTPFPLKLSCTNLLPAGKDGIWLGLKKISVI